MILGRIVGKVSTNEFKFQIINETKKFEYVQVAHKETGYVLAQVLEIEKTVAETIAHCRIIGYRANDRLLSLRTPFDPGMEVLKANNDFVRQVLGLDNSSNSAYIGKLDGRDIKVYLNLDKMLNRHVFVTGKSGSGKSYTVSVLLEALLDSKVPLVIIDPHGEYKSLTEPNLAQDDLMQRFGVKPRHYKEQVQEFALDTEVNPEAKPFKLNNQGLTPSEMLKLLPVKLTNAQMGILYSALKNLGNEAGFDDLIFEIEAGDDSSSKWTLISLLDYVKKLGLFSEAGILASELVKPNACSIINLRGLPAEVQEVIVYKLATDLFRERKKGTVPPFFLVIEEAQNYCPERGFGEAKSNSILRQVAAEGRKFGMGLCIISQRPSRLDKSVISQVSTQIITKVTNPNDVKAIVNSVEGITNDIVNELQNIPIGTALVTGIIDLPLFVNVRPRSTKHGGTEVKIFSANTDAELLPVIKPNYNRKDLELMQNKPVKIETVLKPAIMLKCSNVKDFNLLVDLTSAKIVSNIETGEGFSLANIKLHDISPQQSKVLQVALRLGTFKAAELFAKSGVQFSDLYDLINVLTVKGYFEKNNETYSIAANLLPLSRLHELAFYKKLEYLKIDYDKKLNKIVEPEKVKELLSKFVQVCSMKECWLLTYNL